MLDLDAIQARADAALPGPWEAHQSPTVPHIWSIDRISEDDDDDGDEIAEAREADAEFIANSREDIPALLAEVRVLRARLANQ